MIAASVFQHIDRCERTAERVAGINDIASGQIESASRTLGDRVITTTSVSNVLGNTFGDRDELCFGPCDPGSTIWFNPLRYSREVGRATGLSELEVQHQMSA